MKTRLVFGIVWISMALFAHAQTAIDITRREVTDPLLKIESHVTSFEANDQFFTVAHGATVDRSKQPPLFNRLWGKNGVILLEPLGTNKPAQIDFSAITSSNAGKLRFEIHKHPYGDAELEIRKGDKVIKSRKLNSDTWEYMQVDFDKEPVALVLKANGWHYEFGFVRYVIERSSGLSSFSH